MGHLAKWPNSPRGPLPSAAGCWGGNKAPCARLRLFLINYLLRFRFYSALLHLLLVLACTQDPKCSLASGKLSVPPTYTSIAP